jgi:transposase-like protein
VLNINCLFIFAKKMITSTHTCSKCGSTHIILNGKNKSGTPTYHCKDCKTYRVLFKKKAVDIEAVMRTYQERNSYRSTGRIFQISHVTVFNWLKKSQNPEPF